MADTFPQEPSRVPQTVADIEVVLYDAVESIPPDPEGVSDHVRYSIQVVFDDGSMKVINGNLVPYLNPSIIGELQAFMAMIRTRAVAEVLP